MKTTLQKITTLALTIIIILSLSSCKATKNANNKQKGAAIGVAGGAIIGAILGEKAGKGGNGELGAVIGGAIGGAAGILIGDEMDKQAQEIEEEIPGAVVERVDDGIVITFDENSGVYFDTNKSAINTNSQTTLQKLSNILREHPDTNVLVVGHTDSVGSEKYNMTLSENRANSVTNFFTLTEGLSSSRFTTNWFGETQPTNDNSTSEGRAKNRRVNVVIIPNEKMKKDAEKEADKN